MADRGETCYQAEEQIVSELSELPDPLVPAEVDLRDFQFLPIDITRLFDSEFHARASDGEWRAGMTLWLKSFHQVPAASIPDDDVLLARLAEFGRDVEAWRGVKGVALHGWVKCADGRWYHPVVAEKALEAWDKRKSASARGKAGNAKRWQKNPAAIQYSVNTDPSAMPDRTQADPSATAKGSLKDRGSIKNFSPEDRKGQGQGQGQGQGENLSAAIAGARAHEGENPPEPGADEAEARKRGGMAKTLRERGVAVTPGMPELVGWVASGLTEAEAIEAVARARLRKPDPMPIAAGYLDPIVRDVLAERSQPPRASPGTAGRRAGVGTRWRHDDDEALSVGRQLGIEPRTGESWDAFRRRLARAIKAQTLGVAVGSSDVRH
jgi:hypothetical protein